VAVVTVTGLRTLGQKRVTLRSGDVQAHPPSFAPANDFARRSAMDYLFLRSREFVLSEIARLQERPENGQGMVEYALILVLIAVVVIVILSTVGKRVDNVFSNISNGLSS
jgi:pilus assembly protein Flp/PilA